MEDIKDWYIANSGYVLQLAMPYYEELTVRENLTLAAQMRLSFSMREKFERIEQVMNEVTTLHVLVVKIQIPVKRKGIRISNTLLLGICVKLGLSESGLLALDPVSLS